MLRLAFLLLLILPQLAHADSAYYVGVWKGVDLRTTPDSQAKVTGHLKRFTSVEILEQKRTWRKIKAKKAGLAGWVPEGSIHQRNGAAGSTSIASGLGSLFSRPKEHNAAVVGGVRGLEDETMAQAPVATNSKALAEVDWMESLSIRPQEIHAFIREGKLKP